jgi:lipoyl-dependent peroxiredoxin
MKMTRTGTAAWKGGIRDGKGTLSTESGALKESPYAFSSRFEGQAGTNPEELIGAAHAGCFTMALSLILGEAKLTAERLDTTAAVTIESVPEGFSITGIHLTLRGQVPGVDQAKFEELANKAKAGCPVSKVLDTTITLDAKLVGSGAGAPVAR